MGHHLLQSPSTSSGSVPKGTWKAPAPPPSITVICKKLGTYRGNQSQLLGLLELAWICHCCRPCGVLSNASPKLPTCLISANITLLKGLLSLRRSHRLWCRQLDYSEQYWNRVYWKLLAVQQSQFVLFFVLNTALRSLVCKWNNLLTKVLPPFSHMKQTHMTDMGRGAEQRVEAWQEFTLEVDPSGKSNSESLHFSFPSWQCIKTKYIQQLVGKKKHRGRLQGWETATPDLSHYLEWSIQY